MPEDVNQRIQGELYPGEVIVWAGQPNPNITFHTQDAFLIPFSIFWCGFMLVWEVTAVMGHAPIYFEIWGVPFIAVGLYMLVGRFYYISNRKRRTFYVVTNQRVIIVVAGRFTQVSTFVIQQLPQLHTSVHRNGTGSIVFMPGNYRFGRYQGSGMEIFPWVQSGVAQGFFDIDNVEDVYQRIVQYRQGGQMGYTLTQ